MFEARSLFRKILSRPLLFQWAVVANGVLQAACRVKLVVVAVIAPTRPVNSKNSTQLAYNLMEGVTVTMTLLMSQGSVDEPKMEAVIQSTSTASIGSALELSAETATSEMTAGAVSVIDAAAWGRTGLVTSNVMV